MFSGWNPAHSTSEQGVEGTEGGLRERAQGEGTGPHQQGAWAGQKTGGARDKRARDRTPEENYGGRTVTDEAGSKQSSEQTKKGVEREGTSKHWEVCWNLGTEIQTWNHRARA